jgi:iron(III) transport system ATP-binding protein
MVTHDQEEAQTITNRIFVMKDGEIIQVGTPTEIYKKANSPFIADFIGVMNFIPATIVKNNKAQCISVNIDCDTQDFQNNQSIQLAIRPEDIQLNVEKSDNNVLETIIKEIEFLGSFHRIYLQASSVTKDLIIADLPNSKAQIINLALNKKMNIYFPMENIRIYPN